MFVAVEGLVGALVEVLAYSAPGVARFSRVVPAAGREERVVRNRRAIDRRAIMNRTFAVTFAATAIFAVGRRRPRKPWSVWILHEKEEVYYAVV
jgi:hypothetical protein